MFLEPPRTAEGDLKKSLADVEDLLVRVNAEERDVVRRKADLERLRLDYIQTLQRLSV